MSNRRSLMRPRRARRVSRSRTGERSRTSEGTTWTVRAAGISDSMLSRPTARCTSWPCRVSQSAVCTRLRSAPPRRCRVAIWRIRTSALGGPGTGPAIVPELERHQGPQTVAVVRAAAEVLVQQRVHPGRVNQPTRGKASGVERFAGERSQRPPEPGVKGRSEALLRTIDERVRDAPPHQPPKEVLPLHAGELERRWDGGEEFDELRGEEGRPNLERCRQPRAVDLHQDVFLEVRADVGADGPIGPVARTRCRCLDLTERLSVDGLVEFASEAGGEERAGRPAKRAE